VAEWFKAPVSRTDVELILTVGSNPTSSANFLWNKTGMDEDTDLKSAAGLRPSQVRFLLIPPH
jgi:hypothetical protein